LGEVWFRCQWDELGTSYGLKADEVVHKLCAPLKELIVALGSPRESLLDGLGSSYKVKADETVEDGYHTPLI
jgi:hypothetical protein